jgi:hypothetical protein
MTIEKRTEANRRNARKSTGPKTAAGKAVVSRNAVRHGLLSEESVLPREDAGIFEEFRKALCQELKPVGGLEALLVDRIVSSAWRLRRLITIEVSLFMGKLADIQQETKEDEKCFMVFDKASKTSYPLGVAFRYGADTVSKMSRYESMLERGLYKALHELQRLQAARNGIPVPLPAAIDVDVSVSPEGGANGFVS